MTKTKNKDNKVVNLESKIPICTCNECGVSNRKEDLYIHSKCCNADLDIILTESGRIEYRCQVCNKESGKNIFSFLMRDNMVYSSIGYSKELYKLLDNVLREIGCGFTSFVDFCVFMKIKQYLNASEDNKKEFRDYVEMCINDMKTKEFLSWVFEKDEE